MGLEVQETIIEEREDGTLRLYPERLATPPTAEICECGCAGWYVDIVVEERESMVRLVCLGCHAGVIKTITPL